MLFTKGPRIRAQGCLESSGTSAFHWNWSLLGSVTGIASHFVTEVVIFRLSTFDLQYPHQRGVYLARLPHQNHNAPPLSYQLPTPSTDKLFGILGHAYSWGGEMAAKAPPKLTATTSAIPSEMAPELWMNCFRYLSHTDLVSCMRVCSKVMLLLCNGSLLVVLIFINAISGMTLRTIRYFGKISTSHHSWRIPPIFSLDMSPLRNYFRELRMLAASRRPLL